MWFIVVCLVVMLISKILLDYQRPHGFPPGPRGLPLIGNIFDLKRLVRETRFYNKAWCQLAKEYGPVVALRMGFSEPMIIVSGKEAVFEMLGRSEFDGRPNGFVFRFRSGGVRQGIIFTDGQTWIDQKSAKWDMLLVDDNLLQSIRDKCITHDDYIAIRFTVKTLRRFGFGKLEIEKMVLENALSLTRTLSRAAKEGPIKNLLFLNAVAVLNTVWFIVAGQRFDLDKEDAELTEMMMILHDNTRSINVSGGIMNQLPFLRYILPGLTGFQDFQQRLTRIYRYFRNVMAQHEKNRTEGGEHRDFIDAYLSEIDAQKGQSKVSSFHEDQLMNTIKDLFAAGVETTNSTIGFTITYLAAHQKIQRKLHEEIDAVIGRNGLPSIAEKQRMPYLLATLAEVLRMANIGPTTIPHRAMVDADFYGYKIRKNYSMLANLKSVHMDREHWGDPENFRPERFINAQGDFVEDPWVIPFGLGRRRCMGESLAKNTAFVFVACLLQKFHFRLPEEHANMSLEGVDGFAVTPLSVDFILTERGIMGS